MIPPPEAGQCRRQDVDRRRVVAHAGPLHRRRGARVAHQTHDAAAGPEGGIVEPRPIVIQAHRAISAYGQVDHAGVQLPERFIGQPVAFLAAGKEIGDEQVRTRGQFAQQGWPLGVIQIHGNGTFSPIVQLKWVIQRQVRIQPAEGEATERITAGWLDLDHVRAQVRHQSAPARCGQPIGGLDHPDSLHWCGHAIALILIN